MRWRCTVVEGCTAARPRPHARTPVNSRCRYAPSDREARVCACHSDHDLLRSASPQRSVSCFTSRGCRRIDHSGRVAPAQLSLTSFAAPGSSRERGTLRLATSESQAPAPRSNRQRQCCARVAIARRQACLRASRGYTARIVRDEPSAQRNSMVLYGTVWYCWYGTTVLYDTMGVL
jgi:hypothetical protein